jgi:uncharacterized cupredoxin-like copper-binding protein
MKTLSLVLGVSMLALTSVAHADGDLSRADVTEIAIELGQTDAEHMYFKPDHIDLVTGKAYKLVFKNTANIKHEIAAPDLVTRVFTRKVEVIGADDKMIAEIKGSVVEIELAPGGVAEWFIVPIQPGENIPMVCEIEGHEEAGMVGTITIK